MKMECCRENGNEMGHPWLPANNIEMRDISQSRDYRIVTVNVRKKD